MIFPETPFRCAEILYVSPKFNSILVGTPFIPGTLSSISPQVKTPSCNVIVPTVSKSLVEIVISALLSANCSTSIEAFPIVFPLYGNTAFITDCPTVVAASVLETPFPT